MAESVRARTWSLGDGLLLTQLALPLKKVPERLATDLGQDTSGDLGLVIQPGVMQQSIEGDAPLRPWGPLHHSTRKGMRACRIAPAHIGQGSSVTYNRQPSNRQLCSDAAACVIAIISAWAVGSCSCSRWLCSRGNDAVFVHDNRTHGDLLLGQSLPGLGQRPLHVGLIHCCPAAPVTRSERRGIPYLEPDGRRKNLVVVFAIDGHRRQGHRAPAQDLRVEGELAFLPVDPPKGRRS